MVSPLKNSLPRITEMNGYLVNSKIPHHGKIIVTGSNMLMGETFPSFVEFQADQNPADHRGKCLMLL